MLARVTYMDPWADPLNTGYQAIQSLCSCSEVYSDWDSKQPPEILLHTGTQNDFIFSIIGEELGFIGTATIVILFLMLIWRGLRIALSCPDTFGCLLATGITCMIAIQATLNIAVATVSIPTTGISLPFISSGGSSLLFVMANMGILLNISKTVKTGRS